MATIRIALVGCGNICRNHLKAIIELNDPSIIITTLVDTNISAAESMRENLPRNSRDICKVYSNISEAHSNYDAAVLMVPHDLHVSLASECIGSGKHVLLEKPVATSIQECKQLEQLAANTDRVFMAAESTVFWPEAVHALKLLKEGVIGEPFYAKSNYWEAIGEKDYNEGLVPSWTLDSKRLGGGVVMAGGVHWIRLLRLFLGDVSKVVSVTSHCWDKLKGGESLAHALVKFENGKSGSLYCHYNEIPMETIPFFQIFGPKGEITIHGGLFEGGMTVHSKTSDDGQLKVETTNHGGYFGAFGPQMSHFISCIKRGEGPMASHDLSSIWEATKDVYVAQAIYKSVQTELWENVEK